MTSGGHVYIPKVACKQLHQGEDNIQLIMFHDTTMIQAAAEATHHAD